MTPPKSVPISKRLILVNSTSGIVTRLLTVGVFAWAIQYLIKSIPEDEMALLPIVMSVAMILPFVQSVLTAGLSRHVTEAYARHDLARITAIVSSQFPLLLAAAIGVMFVAVLFAAFVDRVLVVPSEYLGQMQVMVLLVALRLAVGMVLVPFNTGLFAKQRFVVQNSIEIAGSVIRILLMVGLILGLGPRVVWVIVAMVASQLFSAIVTTVVSMRAIPALRYRPSSFDWGVCRENLSFGMWYSLLQLAVFIRKAMDAPILNVFSTPVDVNDFFLGSTVDTQLREMTIRASIPVLPALTAMHAHGQQDRLASAFLRGSRISLWAAMLTATPFIVFSYDLFQLYLGDKYREHVDAATVMIILLLGIPLTNSSSMFSQIAHARGEIRDFSVRAVLSQVVNLTLTLVFVYGLKMGAIGSALGTWIAYAVIAPFFMWPLAMRTLDVSWRRFLTQSLFPGLVPAVLAGCAGRAVALMIESTVIRVCVGVPILIAVYAVGVYLMFQPADRADFSRIRSRIGV